MFVFCFSCCLGGGGGRAVGVGAGIVIAVLFCGLSCLGVIGSWGWATVWATDWGFGGWVVDLAVPGAGAETAA